ncbi:MAG: hypothetical protein ISS93_01450 [Candidatus Aenigmarchaeota archaeon]|nr:hypothetical protein [Candidatus Aenigmarchaeota archaeon]
MMGTILAIVNYFSEKFHLLRHMQRMKFISFSGGVFISYLILHLLPGIFEASLAESRISLVFVLVGFSLFHLLEKFTYRRESKNKEAMRRELKEIHSMAFFFYHLILGIVLVGVFSRSSLTAGILFFIPVLLITLVSSLSLKEIHGNIRQKNNVKLLLSLSSLMGIIAATLFPLTSILYSILLGFVVGVLLFIVIVDSIPKERKGEPVFFILGVVLYSALIGVTWLV